MSTLKIKCVNTGTTVDVPEGSDLSEVYRLSGLQMANGVVSAKVNNKVESMTFRLYNDKQVEFLDITSATGMRTYARSLMFVLAKAVEETYPDAHLRFAAILSNGIKCELTWRQEDKTIETMPTEEMVSNLRIRMQQIIDADMPFQRMRCGTDEAIALFRQRGLEAKARLLESTGNLYTNYYRLGDSVNYFYGSLLLRTGQLKTFDLVRWEDGLLMRMPDPHNPDALLPIFPQPKTAEIFREHHRWQDIMGLTTVGDFNRACAEGRATEIINVAEALQAKKIAHIAEMIVSRPDCRVVLVSGPSSSGKTTFSKRLCIQLMAEGKHPIPISTDDFVVNRVDSPRDENGEYDFEDIRAVDIPFLEKTLASLLAGEKVRMPEFDFTTGVRKDSGRTLQLRGNDVLIIEGLHALNPALTPHIPEEVKFRIFVSALTTILLDEHNLIPNADNLLLRRILRDYKWRNFSAIETIQRWPSVMRGVYKWIQPYQENADVMFNSALLFEFSVLRNHVTPILATVAECNPEYSEVRRLLRFLSYFTPVTDRQLPPTSLLREFVGGSSFKY